MYALVESNNIKETFIKPKSMQIGDFKYAKNIFTLWTESELNAIGLYTVEEDNTNLRSYINSLKKIDSENIELNSK